MREFAMILSLSGPALADGPQTPTVEHQTLDSFAKANRACQEWSDGCAVCLRKQDGTSGCSLPGIACEPRPPACRDNH